MERQTTGKEEVKQLAVSYNAYVKAVQEKNDSEISIWGYFLKTSQRATAVELIPEEDINSMIRLLGKNPEIWT